MKRFLRVFDGEIISPPPIWMMRQAGRYLPEYRETRAKAESFLDFCYSPDLATEVTLQPLRRYGFDAAILFADILVVPDVLGQSVTFEAGVGPVLEPIRSRTQMDRLDTSGALDRLQPVFETVRRISAALNPETALIGFAGAPWTVATYMIEGHGGTDSEKTRDLAYGSPDDFRRLMDILVDTTAAYLIEQVNAGAEVLQLFDSWAGVLSAEGFRRWSVAPTKRIVEIVKGTHPSVPIIGFPRNAGAMIPEYVARTGLDGVSLDHSVPLEWAAMNVPHTCVLQGNLDNRLLVVGGDPLIRGIDAILKIAEERPFIFNLGHGIVPETPPENVLAAVRRVRGEA